MTEFYKVGDDGELKPTDAPSGGIKFALEVDPSTVRLISEASVSIFAWIGKAVAAATGNPIQEGPGKFERVSELLATAFLAPGTPIIGDILRRAYSAFCERLDRHAATVDAPPSDGSDIYRTEGVETPEELKGRDVFDASGSVIGKFDESGDFWFASEVSANEE